MITTDTNLTGTSHKCLNANMFLECMRDSYLSVHPDEHISSAFPNLGQIFVYVTVFQSNHWGSHMCAQKRLWYILSSETDFWGVESESMLTPREKSPLPEKNPPHRRTELTMLHHAGQRAQHTTKSAIPALNTSLHKSICYMDQIATVCLFTLNAIKNVWRFTC